MGKGLFNRVWENWTESDLREGRRKPKNDYEEALARSSEENKEIFKAHENIRNQTIEKIKNTKPEEITPKFLRDSAELLDKYEKKMEAIINHGHRVANDFNEGLDRGLFEKSDVSEETKENDPADINNNQAYEDNARLVKAAKKAEESRMVAERDAVNLKEVRRHIQGIGPEKRESE